jgi:hypothetical protein
MVFNKAESLLSLYMREFMQYAMLVMLLVLGCGSLAVAHAEGPDAIESLRGLPGMVVVVRNIASDATADVLSQEEVQTAVELILRSSGIKVLSETEEFKSNSPSSPYLEIYIAALKSNQEYYSFVIVVSLNQGVQLLTGGHKAVFARTWTATTIGHVRHDKLHQIMLVLEPLVKEFANDFLTVNPQGDGRWKSSTF